MRRLAAIAIDKNVPIPRAVLGRRSLYPWERLQPKDSFFILCKSPQDAEKVRRRLLASAFTFRQSAKGTKFLVRIVDDGKKLGVRAWRLA